MIHKTIVVVGVLALAFAGCKKEDRPSTGTGKTTDPAGGGGGVGAAESPNVTLNASGSTFQKAFQEVAIEGVHQAKRDRSRSTTPRAAPAKVARTSRIRSPTTDAPTDSYKETEIGKIKGGEFVYVPILLGAITVSYNLDGVDKLQLSPETIAKIFQRDITKWNDKAIADDNAGVKLPDTAIVVAHRSDGSGTTEQFTKYLDSAAKDLWKLHSGSTVEWSKDTQGGNGNPGVAQIVKSTKGAVGYVDLPDAKATGLHYALVKNQSGKYIEASTQSAQAAGDGIEMKPDATYVSVNAKGDMAYPITAPTWCLAYTKQANKTKAAALKSFFKFMVTDGQKLIPDIDFAPLSKALQDKALSQIDKIQGS